MTLSSRLKPPFTGSIKAKLKKILKSSDQDDPRNSEDSSDTLKGREHRPSPLSTNVCIPATDHHTRPSIPPLFFDASSSTASLIAASSITCHPTDSGASTTSTSVRRHQHANTQSITSSPSSTLVPSEASYRSPLRPKHWLKPRPPPVPLPVLHSSRAINVNGNRSRSDSSTCSRVSELIANYEALAAQSSLEQQRTGSHTVRLNSSTALMEKEKEKLRRQQDQLRIRSLEKRIAELERECEEQRETIVELREENEVFYTRLCEVNRENKKLKKRVQSIPSPLLSSDDESEIDYGVETPGPSSSVFAFENGHQQPYDASMESIPQIPSETDSYYNRDRLTSNNTNSVDLETLRSDMLARPHGVFDWCSEDSGSSDSEDFYPDPDEPATP
ncbi:hypothetical protein VKT23_010328 [Stygiomarasmius scandens]|uniref:Uncharacterized protein n=1 Tax=Marasmiellus scandens TaxID=2682957 RepID=A0ABR1JG31_9AGAR